MTPLQALRLALDRDAEFVTWEPGGKAQAYGVGISAACRLAQFLAER